MKYFAITLFPEMINSYVNESILGRAIKNKLISVKTFQLRDFTKDKHRRTDGKPFGGGPGMVLWVDPIVNNFEKILKEIISKKLKIKSIRRNASLGEAGSRSETEGVKINLLVVNFVPSAKIFTNTIAKEYAKKYTHIIFICGRYEGIDARVNLVLKDILNAKKSSFAKATEGQENIKFNFKIENISVGDFILTGGELAANIMIDSISRQIDDVLHDNDSIEENRIASSEIYARPEIYEKKIYTLPQTPEGGLKSKKINLKKYKIKKYSVPKVLLSGNHKEIENWRKEK